MTTQPFRFTLFLLICLSIPVTATAQIVNIPDANLRAKIEQALGKASGASITTADMATLTRLGSSGVSIGSNISDLTGLEHATNLTSLGLRGGSRISNLSPLSGLINLTDIDLASNSISNLSPLSGLTNLTLLTLGGNSISNLSPLSGLTQLRALLLDGNSISNLSPLSGLANLGTLSFTRNRILSNLSPLSGLTQLGLLLLDGNRISDLSPLVSNTGLGQGDTVHVRQNPLTTVSLNTHIPTLQRRGVDVQFDAPAPVNIPDPNLRAAIEKALGKASGAAITTADMARLTRLVAPNANISDLTGLEQATNLTSLSLRNNTVSDISAVSGLTNLTSLSLYRNTVSDISAVSGLTNLTSLSLHNNTVSDISAVSGLTNLTSLSLYRNTVSDISAVSGLTNLTSLSLHNNTVSDISAVSGLTNLTSLSLHNNTVSDISAVSGLTNLTSLYLYNNTVSDISAVSGLTNLTSLSLSSNTISDILAVSGLTNLTSLSLFSNTISDISPLVSNTGLGTGDEVDVRRNALNTVSINTHIPTLQRRGVKVQFDKTTPTNTTVSVSPASVESPSIGGQLTLSLKIKNGEKVAGYQVAVEFDTSALRYVNGANGDYLPAGAFFVPPVVSGNTITLAATVLTGESNGAGTLATLTFEVIVVKASTVRLTEVVLSDSGGVGFRPQVENGEIIEPSRAKGDVNRDGVVNIQDLVLAAQRLGQRGQNDADMNGDGVVNIQDLVLVAGAFGNAPAGPTLHPQVLTTLTAADVQGWLTEAEQMALTTPAHLRGIAVLEQLLSVLTPKETTLLANYPNPFNPETWIPYRLAEPVEVTLRIYATNGQVVRTLVFGYQAAGFYEGRHRAAYWDGRNAQGEPVASGVYFYHLSAGDYSATRRMLILK